MPVLVSFKNMLFELSTFHFVSLYIVVLYCVLWEVSQLNDVRQAIIVKWDFPELVRMNNRVVSSTRQFVAMHFIQPC